MRRLLAAGILALTVVAGACGGQRDSSGVVGLLRVSGGRSPGTEQVTAGRVWVYGEPVGEELALLGYPIGAAPITEVSVDATGLFRISLPPGEYTLAGAPVNSGGLHWTQTVEVTPGAYTSVTIVCYFR